MAGESDPFTDVTPEPKRPERLILKLPKSVTHKKINASKHVYEISGLYSGFVAESEDPEAAASICKVLIPDALNLEFDLDRAQATFSAKRELALSELAYVVDDMAKLGGDIPFWGELEARDLEKTKDFSRIRYTIKATDAGTPAELAWFWLPKDGEFRIPLNIGGPELGSLLVVPSTGLCMCHSRFALRILDPEGKLIWKEEDTAYAGVRIALANGGDFGVHKIWLTRNDHGKSTTFVIRAHFDEEKQEIEQRVAPQPSTQSKSESEGGDKPQPESEPRLR